MAAMVNAMTRRIETMQMMIATLGRNRPSHTKKSFFQSR